MILVIALIFLFILIIYRYPFVSFFCILALIGYPYLTNKYNSTANFIDMLTKNVKNWLQNGTLDFTNRLEIVNQLPTDAFTQDIYDLTTEKSDILDADIKNENNRKVFILFPELELYQKWLFEQQYYYVQYQYDIFGIWKKIVSKIEDIIANPTSYSANNITDLFNLQSQLLELFEFINNMSTSTNSNSATKLIVDDIIKRNRTFNTNLVKWLKNNNQSANIRNCAILADFQVSDWVAPSNLMALR